MQKKSRPQVNPVAPGEVESWFADRIPDDWFSAMAISVDRDEILVVGTVTGGGEIEGEEASLGRIRGFREETRQQRIAVAAAAEEHFRRKVSWGATCGTVTVVFTHLSIPAMTRLRIRERQVLDTLVAGGVARSRSDALAWCVRLVGSNLDEWLGELRDAISKVEEVRRKAPES